MTTTLSQKIKTIGKELGVPDCIINKMTSNDACGTSDKDNLGFAYKPLDTYILERNK